MFSLRLKELRENAGLSQYSFAAKFGVAQSTVGSWEAGKREPNFETMGRLADFFHVSVDYLLGRTDDPVDYEDNDLIAQISYSTLKAFDGDVKKAYAFQKQVDKDALNEKPPKILGAAAHLDLSNPEAIEEYNNFLEYLAYKYKDK